MMQAFDGMGIDEKLQAEEANSNNYPHLNPKTNRPSKLQQSLIDWIRYSGRHRFAKKQIDDKYQQLFHQEVDGQQTASCELKKDKKSHKAMPIRKMLKLLTNNRVHNLTIVTRNGQEFNIDSSDSSESIKKEQQLSSSNQNGDQHQAELEAKDYHSPWSSMLQCDEVKEQQLDLYFQPQEDHTNSLMRSTEQNIVVQKVYEQEESYDL